MTAYEFPHGWEFHERPESPDHDWWLEAHGVVVARGEKYPCHGSGGPWITATDPQAIAKVQSVLDDWRAFEEAERERRSRAFWAEDAARRQAQAEDANQAAMKP